MIIACPEKIGVKEEQTLRRVEEHCLEYAKKHMPSDDPSHDVNHALRVLKNAKAIAAKEGGNMLVIIPAALLHDVVKFGKDEAHSLSAAEASALQAEEFLMTLIDYP